MEGPSSTDCDVVVIGGGLAGATAARDLNRAGLSVILVEARDRLGGRTWYRKLANADRTAEVGGTWILTRHYHAIMREVERYGLELVDSPDPNVTFTRMGDNALPGGFPLPYDQLVRPRAGGAEDRRGRTTCRPHQAAQRAGRRGSRHLLEGVRRSSRPPPRDAPHD